MSEQVRIVEVGPRDGLQNEKTAVPVEAKIEFVKALEGAGLKEIEATSFVSPKWVPQLADSRELLIAIGPSRHWVLIPNAKGLELALELGVKKVAFFTAASDAFNQKNINKSVSETLDSYHDLFQQFREAQPDGLLRVYVSTIFECPYAGPIAALRVAEVVQRIFELGADEVSLGDTIGVGTPADVRRVHEALLPSDLNSFAWHFHDTRGTAIANTAEALNLGYRSFDSSAAGLGGCPYAPGAGGNLATEDLVYFCEREGLATGVDLMALAQASQPILQILGRPTSSKAGLAMLASCQLNTPQS